MKTRRYIIEIEEEPFGRVTFPNDHTAHGESLYRAVGFNSLVFDKNGLDKLKPLEKEEEYRLGQKSVKEKLDRDRKRGVERGIEAAWNAAKRIGSDVAHGGMRIDEIQKLFDCVHSGQVFSELEPRYVIKKLEEYDRQKKTSSVIEVGDEIEYDDGTKAVVLDVDIESGFYELNENGCVEHHMPIENIETDMDFHKTGRKITEIETAMEKIQSGGK